jgi:hypothetical protein
VVDGEGTELTGGTVVEPKEGADGETRDGWSEIPYGAERTAPTDRADFAAGKPEVVTESARKYLEIVREFRKNKVE